MLTSKDPFRRGQGALPPPAGAAPAASADRHCDLPDGGPRLAGGVRLADLLQVEGFPDLGGKPTLFEPPRDVGKPAPVLQAPHQAGYHEVAPGGPPPGEAGEQRYPVAEPDVFP